MQNISFSSLWNEIELSTLIAAFLVGIFIYVCTYYLAKFSARQLSKNIFLKVVALSYLFANCALGAYLLPQLIIQLVFTGYLNGIIMVVSYLYYVTLACSLILFGISLYTIVNVLKTRSITIFKILLMTSFAPFAIAYLFFVAMLTP
jgi:hypothetical protein